MKENRKYTDWHKGRENMPPACKDYRIEKILGRICGDERRVDLTYRFVMKIPEDPRH